MTNADRIRSMSDEELFIFLDKFEMGDIDTAKTFCDTCGKDWDCDDCLKWWLILDSVNHPQGLDYWDAYHKSKEV